MILMLPHGCAKRAFFLSVLMLIGEVQAQYFSYTTNNGSLTITGYYGPGGDVAIPSVIDGLPVAAIAGGAFDVFSRRTDPTTVTIPDSVTTIESYTFNECINLTTISIGSGAKSIGPTMFLGCGRLAAINVSSSNPFYTTVDGVLFDKSQTTLVACPPAKTGIYTIPYGVSSVASRAFFTCFGLTGITIPTTVTNLGDGAFSETGITSAKIPSGINAIGTEVFFSCGNLQDVLLPETVTSIRSRGFEACSSLTSITLPKSLTAIEDQAFDICTGLTHIAIPDSVASIGSLAFYSCDNLVKVLIGINVTNISDRAFEGCPRLKAVYFRGNAPGLGVGVFQSTPYATVYYLPETQGWGSMFGNLPAVLWNPHMLRDSNFGVVSQSFGFVVAGTPDIPVLIERSNGDFVPPWNALQICTLTNGLIYFSDPQWTNYPYRYYRIRSP